MGFRRKHPVGAIRLDTHRFETELTFRTTLDQTVERLPREQAAVVQSGVELEYMLAKQRLVLRLPIRDQIPAHCY